MISMKEYAEKNSISYEAVRKQVKRYSNEIGEHIHKEGRTNYLDDIAVQFLDDKRQKNPVVVVSETEKDEKQRLYDENKKLLLEVNRLQEELLAEKDHIIDLKDKLTSEKERFIALQSDFESKSNEVESLKMALNEAKSDLQDIKSEDEHKQPLKEVVYAEKADNEANCDYENADEKQPKTTFWKRFKSIFK